MQMGAIANGFQTATEIIGGSFVGGPGGRVVGRWLVSRKALQTVDETKRLGDLSIARSQRGAIGGPKKPGSHGKRDALRRENKMARDLAVTPRGFIGHEHVDSMGLIHMNGRIYDPHLARFLQADPFMEDTGTLNRYTYVHNNPLMYSDPSGYNARAIFRSFITIVVGLAVPGSWGILGSVFAGALAGAVTTGSLEGVLLGAFSGLVFGSIGEYFQGVQAGNLDADGVFIGGKEFMNTGLTAGEFAAQSVSHGMAGGVIAEMQGGQFGHGFVSAGVSKAVTPGVMDYVGNVYAQGVVIAIVGGTVSEATGGKFANGAATAAMAFAFNQMSGEQEVETLRNTEEERSLLFEEGDVVGYYESRAARGDHYAKLALQVVRNQGLGKAANIWLFNNVKSLNPEQLASLLNGGSYIDFVRRVNVGLAREHFLAVDADNSGNISGLLSANQISEYHEIFFIEQGLPPTTFGGSFLGFRTEYWCVSCDVDP